MVQVPGPEAHPILRDLRQGRDQSGGGLPGGSTGRAVPGRRRERRVHPRHHQSVQADRTCQEQWKLLLIYTLPVLEYTYGS